MALVMSLAAMAHAQDSDLVIMGVTVIDGTGMQAQTKENPFRTMSFKRLSSERDLQPEDDGDSGVRNNGYGCTNIIRWCV